MTTTPPVDRLIAAINAQIGQVGPGRYGVACSGGADSLALADAVIEAAGAARVVVLTIDHGLSDEAAAASRWVAAWAAGRGAAAVVQRVVLSPAGSRELAAREARYAALDALAEAHDLACIFVGHTARDQAETVLMRILRGTGPAGLAAMAARRGIYVRPWLAIERAAIDAYVEARGLAAWSDPMNDDARLARVRVRRELMPRLREENPQLDAALVRLAASAAEWREVIDALARPLSAMPASVAALAAQPPAVRKRAVALALEAAGLDHDAAHLDDIDRLICAPSRGEVAIDVRGGRVVRRYDALVIRSARDASVSAASSTSDVPEFAREAYELRAWRAGDRMRPARLKGRSRKLSDLYIDAKVPRGARSVARVLVRRSDGAIVWAEHLGVAHDSELACFREQIPTRTDGTF